jgi:hypothetical protein
MTRFVATRRRTDLRAVRVIAVRVSRTTGNDVVVGVGNEETAIVSTRDADVTAASDDTFGPGPTIDSSPNPTARVRPWRRILFGSTESRPS